MNAYEPCSQPRPASEHVVLERIVVADRATEILLPVSQAQVVRTYREGDDLLVEVTGGRVLLVEGYFAESSVVDAPALLTSEGPDGQMALMEINPYTESDETPMVARGRLEEMFAEEADSELDLATVRSVDETSEGGWNVSVGTMALGGAAGVVGLLLLTDSDDDGGNSGRWTARDAQVLISSDPDNARLSDWEYFGLSVDQSISMENQETLLENLAAPIKALDADSRMELGSEELQWIADMVQRATSPEEGHVIVSAEFGSLNLGIDTNGDGAADRTTNFETGDNYRPESGEFDDGNAGNGVEQRQQYHYRNPGERAVRTDIDGHGSNDNANGTVERSERDTNGDGTADSWAVSNGDDGTIDEIELSSDPAVQAAFGRVNGGTASWDDFRLAGIDVEDLVGSDSDVTIEMLNTVLTRAREAADGDLTALQVQGIVSLLDYGNVRNVQLDLSDDERIVGVTQHTFGGTTSYSYEEWSFDSLGSNAVEYAVGRSTSAEVPDVVNAEENFRIDFGRMLGFREIMADVDFDADSTYDVSYLGEFQEAKDDYVIVAAEFLSGGTFDAEENTPIVNNLEDIFEIGRLRSIKLHADETELVLTTEFLRELADEVGSADGTGPSIVISGDANDSIDFDSDIVTGANAQVGGASYETYQATRTETDSATGLEVTVTMTVYVDPDITVDVS